MELYLDSANLTEIKTAFDLGFLHGLTTTPTFMHRDGIDNIDDTILQLAGLVPVLQVEALGKTATEIEIEAHRLLKLGLDPTTTVFKIPISMEGAKACKRLTDQGLLVNLHLIYTLQQAYIAFSAGATYVCPLVGRLQDQGQDALGLIAQCVQAVNRYQYPSKVMFSSVRYPEHVRNALNLGVHACTIPWKVMKQLASNHFTDIGTQQFFEHNRLMTVKVKEVMRTNNVDIAINHTILDALVKMTTSTLGAITLLKENGQIYGVFTDGDLRRLLEKEGEGILKRPLSSLPTSQPKSIDKEATLNEASLLFKQHKVDTIVVVDGRKPVGMLDIQELLE